MHIYHAYFQPILRLGYLIQVSFGSIWTQTLMNSDIVSSKEDTLCKIGVHVTWRADFAVVSHIAMAAIYDFIPRANPFKCKIHTTVPVFLFPIQLYYGKEAALTCLGSQATSKVSGTSNQKIQFMIEEKLES